MQSRVYTFKVIVRSCGTMIFFCNYFTRSLRIYSTSMANTCMWVCVMCWYVVRNLCTDTKFFFKIKSALHCVPSYVGEKSLSQIRYRQLVRTLMQRNTKLKLGTDLFFARMNSARIHKHPNTFLAIPWHFSGSTLKLSLGTLTQIFVSLNTDYWAP